MQIANKACMYSVKHLCTMEGSSKLSRGGSPTPTRSKPNLSNLNSILSLIILFNLFLFNVSRCWGLSLSLGSLCLAISTRALAARFSLRLCGLILRCSRRLIIDGHLGHWLSLSLPIIFFCLAFRGIHGIHGAILRQDFTFALAISNLILILLLLVLFLNGLTFLGASLIARLEFLFEYFIALESLIV